MKRCLAGSPERHWTPVLGWLCAALVVLGSARAGAPCGGPLIWATANVFGPTGTVTGVTTPETVESGAAVSLGTGQNLSQMGDRIWALPLYARFDHGNPATLREVGARFRIVQEPDNPDGTRVFEVFALVRQAHRGAGLAVKIRRAPMGNTGDVNADMPEVPAAGAIWMFNPQPAGQDFGWVRATVDLGPAAALTTGDYYFCLAYQPPVPWTSTWYFDYAAELDFPRGGFQTPSLASVGDSSYTTAGPDPLLVIRPCDPTPANRPPTAVASVTGPVADQFDFQTGTTVAFDGSKSKDPDGAALTFSWTFGDGTTSAETSPAHAFNQAGNYAVTLTVSDGWYQVFTQVLVRIQDAPPPRISALDVERRDGVDGWTSLRALHVGDDRTELRMSPTVTASDGGECTGCTFEWTWDGVVFSGERVPSGTALDLGLGYRDPGVHEIVLKVTDNEPLKPRSASRRVLFTVSRLPSLRFEAGPATWGGPGVPDFDYRMRLYPVLQVEDVAMQAVGRVEMTDLAGAPIPRETPVMLDSVLMGPLAVHTGYAIPGLVRQGHDEWDPDHCEQPIGALRPYAVENLDLKAISLVDENGFTLPPIRSTTPLADRRLDIGPDKRSHYDQSYASWLSGWALQAEAVGLAASAAAAAATGVGAVAGGVLAIGAAAVEASSVAAFQNHDRECTYAHDPIVPDPAYQVPAVRPESAFEFRRSEFTDPGVSNIVWLAESIDVSQRAETAYLGSLNKLAGLYEGLPPRDPAWRSFALQRGTDVVRNGQILADALGQVGPAWTQSAGSMGLTTLEFDKARQTVATQGLPGFLVWHLEALGADPSRTTSGFLAVDGTRIVEGWNAGWPAMFEERAAQVLSQSYFAAPSGLVLVGITQPWAGSAVNGVITIDARVVHKTEAYHACQCGKTVVTEIRIDGQIVAQVPAPAPDCPVPLPALSAVPFHFDTRVLPEGPHTLTVVARDGCVPVPPDEVLHRNSDTLTFRVDRTAPVIQVTSPDVDPSRPGMQVYAGDMILWQSTDPGGAVVGSGEGRMPSLQGHYRQPIPAVDQAGNATAVEVEVIPGPDSDINGNGIPDAWDAVHLAGVDAGGDADPDGDRATNRSEYIAGTDPKSADSVFRVTFAGGDRIEVGFLARSAHGVGYGGRQRFYTLESTASLTSPEWKEDPEYRRIPGGDREIRYETAPLEPGRFFRVRVELERVNGR